MEIYGNFFHTKNGQVESVIDILPIYYCVYAAKFAPTFPFLMLIGDTYSIILLGYILLEHKDKMFSYFLSCLGVLYLGLSSFVSKSPTDGLKFFLKSSCSLAFYQLLLHCLEFLNIRLKKYRNS